MVKSLNSQKDRQDSARLSTEKGKNYIKFDEGDNYIMLLSPEYKDGKKHFLKTSKDASYSIVVPCNVDESNNDMDPNDQCAVHAFNSHLFELAREAKDDMDEEKAKAYRSLAFINRAQYSAVFKAIKGYVTYEHNGGEVKGVPTFEGQPVGKLSIDDATKDMLFAIIGSSSYPSITMGDDLIGYILNFSNTSCSGKNGGKSYKRITSVVPVKRYKGNLQALVNEAEKLDLEDEFKPVTNAEIEQRIERQQAGASEDAADANVYSDATDLDDYSSDDFLDDDEPVVKKTKKKSPAKKKATTKKTTAKKTATKKKATTKKKPVSKKTSPKKKPTTKKKKK